GDQRRWPAHLLQGRNEGSGSDRAEGKVAGNRQISLKRGKRTFDLFELRDAVERPHCLDPASIGSGSDPIHFVKGVVAVLGFPKEARHRIESEAEAVAVPIRKNLMDVGHEVIQLRRRQRYAGLPFELGDLSGSYIGERVVAGNRAVGIEPEDTSSQMGVVRFRTTELIIRMLRSEGTVCQILQLSA